MENHNLSVQQQSLIENDCSAVLKNTPCGWQRLRGMRLFLTGGTGFFGKWLLHSFLYANHLLHLNASMTVLSRSPQKFLEQNPCFADKEGLAFTEGDVRDFKFPEGKFDLLIHAATPASAKLLADAPEEMSSIIVEGTRHALNFAHSAGVKRMLLTSSGAVYGVQPPDLDLIPETSVTAPVTAYGQGKLKAEQLCRESGIDAVIVRCFAFVGPYLPLDIHYAVGNFIRDGLNGREIVITGDGRPYRSYLYAADLVCWLWTVLFSGRRDSAYNVGSENSLSIGELARLTAGCFMPAVPVRVIGKADLQVPAPRYVPCTARARTELGCVRPLDCAMPF